MKRVMVIGCPGSGKSTFSRALAARTGLPLFYLDRLYWKADKTTVGHEVLVQRLEQILKGEAWILDGHYAATLEMRLRACDTVIFLDYPVELCLQGLRERLGRPRPDMPWVETEPDEELLAKVRAFAQESRPVLCKLLERYPEKKLIRFSGRDEADAFLARLKEDRK